MLNIYLFNQLTWVGAMNCLKKNNFTPASYQDEEDIEFFNEYIPEGNKFRN